MNMKEEIGKVKTGARYFWTPLVVGGVIGAGVALLLAPKSGRELRKDFKDLASKTRDRVTATIDEGKTLGKHLYDESRMAVKGAIEGGKHAFMEEREKHLKAA
jgi:gas vesicle protein